MEGSGELTDVVIEPHEGSTELCTQTLASLPAHRAVNRTLVALHDNPYPRADTLVDELWHMVSKSSPSSMDGGGRSPRGSS